MDLDAELRRIFACDRFRPGQRPLVEALLAGRDALGILPTGGGKSLCYQLPALLTDGLTVVVSPLISLMKDQVDGLRRRGITTAAEIHSHLPPGEAWRRLRDAAGGRLRLLYVAPERLAHAPILDALRRAQARTFVVDEAHCMSHWGHDFRPDYLDLARRAAEIGARSTLALTATATPRVRAEIARLLALRAPCVIVNPFDRPNLTLRAEQCPAADRIEAALRHLGREGSAIVYVGRQKDAETVATQLDRAGVRAVPYHGGLDRVRRAEAQDAWVRGKARVVVGTVAFGMGIDKPDVRAVIHLHLPGALEAYYQEIGRAGRDGAPAHCTLLWDGRDLGLQKWFIENRYPSRYEIVQTHAALRTGSPGTPEVSPGKFQAARAWLLEHAILHADGSLAPLPDPLDLEPLHARRKADASRLAAMVAWARARRCRRSILLRYFGEKHPADLDCRNCDVCLQRPGAGHDQARIFGLYTGRTDPDDEAARKAVATAVGDLGPRGLDRRALAGLLEGRPAAARAGLRGSPSFAALRGLPARRRDETVEALVEEGALETVPGQKPLLAAPHRRSLVPLAQALAILRILLARPGTLNRTRLLRLLPGDRRTWAEAVESLAKAGYVTADGEARLALSEKGRRALEQADSRGVVGEGA